MTKIIISGSMPSSSTLALCWCTFSVDTQTHTWTLTTYGNFTLGQIMFFIVVVLLSVYFISLKIMRMTVFKDLQ